MSGNTRDLGYDLLDLMLANNTLLLRLGLNALRRAGLVNDINRLIRQVPVIDKACRKFRGGSEGGYRIFDLVMRFKTRLQAPQNCNRFVDRGLHHIDFLETTRQRVIFFENAPELGVRGCSDAFELPGRQRWLEQVGRVQRSARRRPSADQRVNLVDEQDRVRIFGKLFENRLEPLFEITAVLGASKQRAHVQRINLRAQQDFRHATLNNTPRKPLGDGGFANTGLTNQQRIVLAPPAQGLNDPLELTFASDERINFAGNRQRVQIKRVIFERTAPGLLLLGLTFSILLLFGRRRLRQLGDAVRDEVDNIEASHAFLMQEINGVRVFFAEYRHQDIGTGDFFLTR